eukprot:6193727-Pleurochrysis_carterae.AAC.1
MEPDAWTVAADAGAVAATADTDAAKALGIWPLDEHNTTLLNAVHPKNWPDPIPRDEYDLIVIGSGAGGLVSAKQSARRGAHVAMISEHLAGGDCLNVGCVRRPGLNMGCSSL